MAIIWEIRAFNAAGVARSGVDYSDFLEAALDVGVLGIVDGSTSRYTDVTGASSPLKPARSRILLSSIGMGRS